MTKRNWMMHLAIMSAYLLGTSYFPEETSIKYVLLCSIFNMRAHRHSYNFLQEIKKWRER
jgi:hypothetical protein